ncbi:hypothetical protein KL907_005325 [Ogataea polymorpha]|nr:hypothetical protein KL907_005325 [Ogataea polymorpha]
MTTSDQLKLAFQQSDYSLGSLSTIEVYLRPKAYRVRVDAALNSKNLLNVNCQTNVQTQFAENERFGNLSATL